MGAAFGNNISVIISLPDAIEENVLEVCYRWSSSGIV